MFSATDSEGRSNNSVVCRLTWHPIWPPTMRPMSVCDHRLLAHGSIYFRLCVKFTVSNLLWTNLRMFQGKSLCLKINKKRYLVNHYMHTKSNILLMNNIIFCNFWNILISKKNVVPNLQHSESKNLLRVAKSNQQKL